MWNIISRAGPVEDKPANERLFETKAFFFAGTVSLSLCLAQGRL